MLAPGGASDLPRKEGFALLWLGPRAVRRDRDALTCLASYLRLYGKGAGVASRTTARGPPAAGPKE
eukprot:scaffold30354_cov26-Tisochrysis_lutea.AAC.1